MTINQEAFEEQPAPVSAASSVGPMPSVLPKKDPWYRQPAVRRAAPFAITAIVALGLGFGLGDIQGASLQTQNKALTHEVATLKAKVNGQKIALSAARDVATSCTSAFNLEVKAAHQMANSAASLDDAFVQYMSDFNDTALNDVAAQANTDSATATATQKQAYAAGCGDGSGDGS